MNIYKHRFDECNEHFSFDVTRKNTESNQCESEFVYTRNESSTFIEAKRIRVRSCSSFDLPEKSFVV